MDRRSPGINKLIYSRGIDHATMTLGEYPRSSALFKCGVSPFKYLFVWGWKGWIVF